MADKTDGVLDPLKCAVHCVREHRGPVRGAEMEQAVAKVAELLAAAEQHAGTPDDPKIGWLGETPSNRNLFKCESCGQEDLDCTKIHHTEACTVARLFTAIRAMRGEPPVG